MNNQFNEYINTNNRVQLSNNNRNLPYSNERTIYQGQGHNQLNRNNQNFNAERLNNQPFPRLYNQYQNQELIENNNQNFLGNQQHRNINYQILSVRSTDKIFKNSYDSSKNQLSCFQFYQTFKAVYLIIFILAYYTSKTSEIGFTIMYIISSINSLIYMTIYAKNLSTINNLQNAIKIARNLGHDEQVAIRSDKNIELGLADIYDKVNEQNNYLSDQQKKSKEEILKTQILHEVKKMSNLCYYLQKLCDGSSIFTIIGFIVCLSIFKSNSAIMGCTIFFIILEFISKFYFFAMAIFIIVLLGLSPLICLGICFYGCYLCCCTGRFNYRFIPPPEFPSEKYNPRMSLQTSQCAICLQTFVLDDDFIRLPCNKNHIFHKFCIQSWLKMRTQCPLCRREITDDMNSYNNN